MLVSVPLQVVMVVHVLEQVSEADDAESVTVEHRLEQLVTGDAEQELEEELDEPSEELAVVAEGDGVPVTVFGSSSPSNDGGPVGCTAGICIDKYEAMFGNLKCSQVDLTPTLATTLPLDDRAAQTSIRYWCLYCTEVPDISSPSKELYQSANNSQIWHGRAS